MLPAVSLSAATRRLLAAYPAIFLACHQEHRRDPEGDTGISAHQGSILDHLDTVAPMSLTELAQHMGVTPSTMSLHVDRLEASRLVTRTKDAADKRRVLLLLTAAGQRVKRAGSVLEPSRVEGLLRRLSPAQREASLAGLELLATAARECMAAQSRERAWATTRRPAASPGSDP